MVKIHLYCCHHQYHTPYLGHCALIGCTANGVEIFHFVQSLSCFKRTPIGGTMCILEGVNSEQVSFSHKHLVLERKERDAEIENRQDKG